MCNWNKWIWPWLIVPLVLAALALWMKSELIENDLTAKASSNLASAHPWAKVELDGRDLTLSGVAPSEEAVGAAEELADSAYDVRVVASNVDLLPLADPFKLSAVKGEGSMVLTGNIADEAMRSAIVKAAEAANPGAAITDEMTLARGAPAGFAALAGFGISQLTSLTKGEASLENMGLSVSGDAPDFDVYDAVTGALGGALPEGGNLVAANINAPTVPSYLFQVDQGESVILSGFAPSTEAIAAIGAAAAAANPGKDVVNNLKIANGAPDNFIGRAEFAIGQANLLSSGMAKWDGADYTITGMASSFANYDKARGDAQNALPANSRLALEAIKPAAASPYNMMATKSDNGVVLSGFVPSDDVRARLVANAGKITSGSVTDELKLASGEHAVYNALSDYGIARLGGLANGTASLSDNKLTVSGTAATPEDYDATMGALESLPDGAELVSRNILRPMVSSYTLTAIENGEGITLDGFIPDEKTRKNIIFVASKATSGKVTDNLVIARGAPDNYSDIAQFGVSHLKHLTAGTAVIDGVAVTVRGIAHTAPDYIAANRSLDNDMPRGGKLALKDIQLPTASPFEWTFDYPQSGQASISGHVPSTEIASAAIDQAKNAIDANVSDRQQLAGGAPSGFAEAVELGIDTARQLKDAKAHISNNVLHVSGQAKSEAHANHVRSRVEASVPSGFAGHHAITFPAPVDICQQMLTDIMKTNKILFEFDKAVIRPESHPVLQKLVKAVGQCPTAKVDIGGHTDADGPDVYNNHLSKLRAAAVVQFMVGAGVDKTRLTATGYGEGRPIADNTTEEGKAQNRRIEFTVTK